VYVHARVCVYVRGHTRAHSFLRRCKTGSTISERATVRYDISSELGDSDWLVSFR